MATTKAGSRHHCKTTNRPQQFGHVSNLLEPPIWVVAFGFPFKKGSLNKDALITSLTLSWLVCFTETSQNWGPKRQAAISQGAGPSCRSAQSQSRPPSNRATRKHVDPLSTCRSFWFPFKTNENRHEEFDTFHVNNSL